MLNWYRGISVKDSEQSRGTMREMAVIIDIAVIMPTFNRSMASNCEL